MPDVAANSKLVAPRAPHRASLSQKMKHVCDLRLAKKISQPSTLSYLPHLATLRHGGVCPSAHSGLYYATITANL